MKNVTVTVTVGDKQFTVPANVKYDVLQKEVSYWGNSETEFFVNRVKGAAGEACLDFFYENKVGRYANRKD